MKRVSFSIHDNKGSFMGYEFMTSTFHTYFSLDHRIKNITKLVIRNEFISFSCINSDYKKSVLDTTYFFKDLKDEKK